MKITVKPSVILPLFIPKFHYRLFSVKKFINNPQKYQTGSRRMVDYDFSDQELEDLYAFFKWIGEIDLNGFPPEPNL